jgi:thioredoxin reductase
MASTTVTELRTATPGRIEATLDASGSITSVTPAAVLIATGTRERPRSARLIAGDRPAGIYTTGALQQLVLARRFTGKRAVILGAEHVSFSAILTLGHAGCATVAVVTPERRHQTYAGLRWGTAGVRRVPVLTGTTVVEITGGARVAAVVVRRPSGALETLACDTVIVSGDWVPDHELVRRSGLMMDPGSLAPPVDAAMRLMLPGWFAAGNLLHGAETADVCALDGRHAAQAVLAWLADPVAAAWPRAGVGVQVAPPFAWAFPNRLSPGTHPPRDRLLLRLAPMVPIRDDWADHQVTEPRPGLPRHTPSPNPHVTEPDPGTPRHTPSANPHVTEPDPGTPRYTPSANSHVTEAGRKRHVEIRSAGEGSVAPGENRHVEIRPADDARYRRGSIEATAIRAVEIRQGDREIWEGRLRGAIGPNRTAWIPTDWIDAVHPVPLADPGLT